MTQHTKLPWAVNPLMAQIDAFDGENGMPLPVCQLLWPTNLRTESETEANAERIVACVTACAGIDIDYLQSPDNLATYARNMALQRDEAHKQLFEIRALVGAQTEELIQDAIKRLIAERDQCKADFEAQFNKVGA